MSWLLLTVAPPALVQEMMGGGEPRPLQPSVTPDPTPTRHDLPPPTAMGACVGVGVGRAVSRGDWLPSPATVVAVTHTWGRVDCGLPLTYFLNLDSLKYDPIS